MTADETVDHLLAELALLATTPYGGEAVDQQAHALQAATMVQADGGDDHLVAAALLHDLGYSQALRDLRPGVAHEVSAAEHLRPLLGDRVAELIAAHVLAKRVLVATDPAYAAKLSPASVSSLRAQGGPANPTEVAAAQANDWWDDAVRLRVVDDLAKVPDAVTPPPAHFAPTLHRLAAAQAHAATSA